MGWAVLYIAFGLVALWLLGEVLLQHKARLRWRLVAFTGFLGVVAGVLASSVLVIGAGAAAFAVGQVFVTLSFRRGFTAGWALKKDRPAASRGTRTAGAAPAAADREPEPVPVPEPGQPPLPTYQPEPLPDDTGGYAAYRDPEPQAATESQPGYAPYATAEAGHPGYGSHDGHAPGSGGAEVQDTAQDGAFGTDFGGYPGHGAVPDPASDGAPDHAGVAGGPAAADHDYGDHDYGYGTDAGTYPSYPEADPYQPAQQPYPAYQDGAYDEGAYDPYGQYATAAGDPYAVPDPYAAPAGQDQVHDPYHAAQPYLGPDDTPPGGVWVPQQREGDGYPAPPQYPAEQPYEQEPDPGGYGPYRY
ncbi:hypothetical protein [Streptomyces pactum]|uniref:hypothetical protein n=1 Tax=Streptomyces pactum TaxID=68249 RepID=UPI0036F4F34A